MESVVDCLEATSKNPSEISLRWSPPSDVIAAIQYNVEYYITNNESKKKNVDAGRDPSYVIKGLERDSEYNITVRVCTMLGSMSSNSASVVCSTAAGLPSSAPQNLQATVTADEFIHSNSGFNVIAKLTWSSLSANQNGFHVYYRKSEPVGEWEVTNVTDAAAKSFSLKGLVSHTNYEFQIACFNASGEGPRSSSAHVKSVQGTKFANTSPKTFRQKSGEIRPPPPTEAITIPSKSHDYQKQQHRGGGGGARRKETPPSLPRDTVVSPIAVDTNSPKSIPTLTSPPPPPLEFNLSNQTITRRLSQAERDRDAERVQMSMWETSRVGSHDNKHKHKVLSPTEEVGGEGVGEGVPTTHGGITPSTFTAMRAKSAVDLVATSNPMALFETDRATAQRLSPQKPHRLSKTNPLNTPVVRSRQPSQSRLQSHALTSEEQEWEKGLANTPGLTSFASSTLLDALNSVALKKVSQDDDDETKPQKNTDAGITTDEGVGTDVLTVEEANKRRQQEYDQGQAWERKVGAVSDIVENTKSKSYVVPENLSADAAELRRLEEIRRMDAWEAKVGGGGKVKNLTLGGDDDEEEEGPPHEGGGRPRSRSVGNIATKADKYEHAPKVVKLLSRVKSSSSGDLLTGARKQPSAYGPIQSGMTDFMDAVDLETMLVAFERTCTLAEVEPKQGLEFFDEFKTRITSKIDFKRGHLLRAITKRIKAFWEQKEIKSCEKLKCVVIGAGPVGLRTAIEMALLGADVTVIEMRTTFSRLNILHLWDWVCNDLYELGCSGAEILGKSFFHIGTKQLQLLLAKVCLCLGVKIYSGVKFVGTSKSNTAKDLWTVDVAPDSAGFNLSCPKSIPANVLFDAGGAAGAATELLNFERKRTKMSTALGIVAHFEVSSNDRDMAEFSVSSQFKQTTFKKLRAAGLDLENVVYYQGETHYYVMTPTTASLKLYGVINKVHAHPSDTVKSDNINRDKLHEFARQVADFFELPGATPFINDRNSAQLFDFSSRSLCKQPLKVLVDDHKNQLTVQIVGDALIEPFWPEGLGVNRGFLAVLDAAYNVQQFFNEGVATKDDTKKMLKNRDKLFQIQRVLSAHTKKETLREDVRAFTIMPMSRYLKWKTGY